MKKVLVKITPLFSGLLFGLGMAVSGMMDPTKVIGFLDVAGTWDPSLAFVMGGALLVFIPSYIMLIKPKSTSLNGDVIAKPTSSKIDNNLVVGSALFGIGWGIAGICPGPAVSSLAAGGSSIILFLAAMVIGSLLGSLYLNKKQALIAAKAN
ncbi:YeeE/YedE family protein [Vibrio aquaticus]|uniref:YeeE/YedE family protein n=1 Tax=Vibrio aquaticus TaxID=2496559 RepID=A0A3S0PQ33_9VIBR|nr:YeeE/YedE family protein [Vibrio aquaticus]RTZ17292.1 YeeE/YedE family protein [Vibrio aquaticus]